MIRFFTVIALLFLTSESQSQQVVDVTADFRSILFSNQIEYFPDSSETLKFSEISGRQEWKTFQGSNPNFGENPYPHWLRFSVKNNSDQSKKLTLLTKGIDSLQTFLTLGDSLVKTFPINGSHIPLRYREHASPYLTLTFDVLPGKEYTVWTRIRNLNYRLTASPFTLYEESEAKQFLQRKTFFQSFYIGGMGIMLLFSVVLVVLFRDWLYAYYLGCVLCSLSIMLIYNDYTFLLFDKLPHIVITKDMYAIIAALVPALYVLFAEKYLMISPFKQTRLAIIAKVIVATQLVMLFFFISIGIPLFDVRALFYPPMMALSTISLVYVYQSLKKGYVPAWLFLLGTAPVSVAVMLETGSDLHSIPVQDIHEIYYYATLFEMFALTCGLAFRFKLDFDHRKTLQKEILLTQIKSQEKERVLIAGDLHDIIGSQISAVKLNLEYLQNKYFADSNSSWWTPVHNLVSILSENISSIADRMRNSSLEKMGLPAILEQMFGHIPRPEFRFDFVGMDQRIPADTERALYIVIIEALNNCVKHARATLINVQLIREENLLTVIIEDNGQGFTMENVLRGEGLKNMKARVDDYLQGQFIMDSQPGKGTVIIIKVNLGRTNEI